MWRPFCILNCCVGRLKSPSGRTQPSPRLLGGQAKSERKQAAVPCAPPLHRQSISERKPAAAHKASLLPQPAGLARKSLHFGGHTAAATTKNFEFKMPQPPGPTRVLGKKVLPLLDRNY